MSDTSSADTEKRLYAEWEEQGCFEAGRVDGDAYTIVIPPPNVTGNLHMGHALNNTLQDILCRFERMRGRDVLWQPGTDHAGIATQMVVERQLAEAGEPSRRDMGREAFLERVWQWKEESGSTITQQLRRLGASCDWSRERFTMDEGLSKAVLKVFVTLHQQGLIYKDKRLVNWDPKLLTAISDLEVVQKEVNSHLWHFKYPLEDGSGHITVATTRPETMLGDTGVAVHPDDGRYADLVGKNITLPIVGRKIPIVADSYADPEQGSGAVKITPAHDFNDFEVGRRCNLSSINILDKTASIELNEEDFSDMKNRDSWQGLDRFEARKRVIDEITTLGLLDKIEDNTHMVPFGDRSDVLIEPWLTDQWYVDAATLAKPAIEAVQSGQTKFVPANWEKTYFDWMENIQPWCISRQLWWGHQIPAWYGPDGEIFVAESEQDAHQAAKAHYGQDTELTRDEDVLDTWFSSALWPFSTLGWPDETPELQKHYKTDVLVTGFDIIFFWVARMMMMGLHFKQEVPFHTVYIHALVRDEKGAKMSKSKGNVIDPLELADKYTADALRFTLSAMAAMGRDIKLSESRVEGYRNFATKLRNATRFCEMNECFTVGAFNPAEAKLPLTQWLVGETYRAKEAITASLEAYRFNDASNAVYQFIWDGFCDWFIELAKPILQGEDEAAKIEVQAAAQWGLQNALKLLHPFMPYVTEELWQEIKPADATVKFLMLETWPQIPKDVLNKDADAEINWVIKAITIIRSVRSEMNVPAGSKIPLIVSASNDLTQERLTRHEDVLKRLARLDTVSVQNNFPEGAIQSIVDEAVFAIHLNEVIDIAAEADRLKKEIAKVEQEIAKISGKLGNKGFLEKAPDAVIEENKSRLQDEQSKLEKLETALSRLN
ncbi:MAG: valine--tRNA ligase [PS1 clade bacterium]|uniref:Valine--tRNA ligase n=1 Tax=PS1 clade bacterium TaxID=2175152 RepID=A0A368E1W8_9PROT|nr:MAG: valine--tRNA ligase [PS1 clade bacterium]HCV48304.1 valine--tRNA ligase [Rhodobiaceae bacterium]